ncbi:hypothetical protein DRA43_19920 [Micromonospora provocatoris]|nr:hypothetical protein DRA43_19920 [Micromonospora provocatoris]
MPITSTFGPRTDPITGVSRMHNGTDYSYSGILGYPIRSIAAGTVTGVSYSASGLGHHAVITHADGWRSVYGHMRETPRVGTGTQVAAGQHIGNVGSTGHSTGPHLHLEIFQPNGQRVDPESVLKAPDAGARNSTRDCHQGRTDVSDLEHRRYRLPGNPQPRHRPAVDGPLQPVQADHQLQPGCGSTRDLQRVGDRPDQRLPQR